ncbi:ATPase synthesis protein 25 mitochondrial [Ascosphaera aggregata]|nr:ATPase synthesis protein 25 mitochondrial [Ascosphaera aggregata]
MSLQGQDIFHTSILTRLHRATMFKAPVYLAPKRQVPFSIPAEHAYPVSKEECHTVFGRQGRIRKIMRLSFTQLSAEEFPQLLRMHLYQGQYGMFWDIWRRSAILGIPRTKEVYLQVFEMMAERANEKLIWDMIWEIVPMMGREATPVNMDKDLAKALMTCLAIVDPKIQTTLDDAGLSKGKGPLVKLWNQCMKITLREMAQTSP